MAAITVIQSTDQISASRAVINANFSNLNADSRWNLPEGVMRNGRISVSVDGSGNLTVALKTLAGANPSTSDPVDVMIGGVVRSITGALSLTSNAGQNWLNLGSAELATKEVDLFTYLHWQTNQVILIVSRFPGANIISDFDYTHTAGAEKGVIVSSGYSPATTDPCCVIGRFAATLSAGAGYTWSVPTFTASNLIQAKEYQSNLHDFVSTGAVANCVGIGKYRIIRNRCVGWLRLDLTGAPGFDTAHMPKLPFTPANENTSWSNSIGYGGYEDGGSYIGGLTLTMNASGYLISSGTTLGILSNTVPITWANTDAIIFRFDYEI